LGIETSAAKTPTTIPTDASRIRYAAGDWMAGDAFEDFSAPAKFKAKPAKIGRSPLLGER
jgi:hypothetical protein